MFVYTISDILGLLMLAFVLLFPVVTFIIDWFKGKKK